jgi:uncharacterized repeat protein (TIGR03803 family)
MVVLALAAIASSCVVAAAEEHILYSFTGGSDGQQPWAGVTLDDAGNLYGVATFAGINENCGPSGCGTIFKLTPEGSFSVLYNFDWDHGANPASEPVLDPSSGDLYGTTLNGGSGGAGVVFKLAAGGTLTVLHAFDGNDGVNPEGRLIRDRKGNIFGTAYGGGANNKGVVYKISSMGRFKLLHSFAGGADDGWNPTNAGLAMDRDGSLYGMTQFGGVNDYGTVFRISPAGKFELLHSFLGGSDGRYPAAGLVADKTGNIFGTTQGGGGHDNCLYGCGTVFMMTPGGEVTVLHAFEGGSDGANPLSQLAVTKKGVLFGTTNDGSNGTVFKLDRNGKEAILHRFGGAGDGIEPRSGVIRDSAANLYGTTELGGASGSGAVFVITK